MGFGEWVVIILSISMLAWYVIMSTKNRQKGVQTYRWLRKGLERDGKIVEARWLGASSSGAKIICQSTKNDAYKEIHASYFLENREILPLWLYNHWRGQRDVVVFQILLSQPPKESILIKQSQDHQFEKETPSLKEKEINWVALNDIFSIASDKSFITRLPPYLLDFISDWKEFIYGVSIQKKAPHLILKTKLNPLIESDNESFFDAFFHLLKQMFSN